MVKTRELKVYMFAFILAKMTQKDMAAFTVVKITLKITLKDMAETK